jgi:hypothetical protein
MNIEHEHLHVFLQTTLNTSISSMITWNPSTYTINNNGEYLVKLVCSFMVSFEQLQAMFISCQLNGHLLGMFNDRWHVVLVEQTSLLSVDFLGRFLARWRLLSRQWHEKTTCESMIEQHWWNQYYQAILQQKKTYYPFLLANLYTCQEQIATEQDNACEIGIIWSENERSYYLMDIASALIRHVEQTSEQIQAFIHAYEDVLPLTDNELVYIDAFVRLQLIRTIIDQNNSENDETLFDRLEYLSSNVFYIKNLVR